MEKPNPDSPSKRVADQDAESPPAKRGEKRSYKTLPDPGWKIKAGGWSAD
ncbi:MAG: hypothetical protein OXI51_10420 [Chloroflexota bacterium]|nr:hypothetical protein [Chloroflexota bacterium]MDE2670055.1 hypothetical protein [Chloroflexota bacterium]